MTTREDSAGRTALPELAGNISLTDGQIEAYRTLGHVRVQQVVSGSELAAYEPLITEAALRFNTEQRPLAERSEMGKAFLQTINLWQRSAGVRRFVTARRFAKVAAALLETSSVRLYLDQTFYKEAGGAPTPWHRDNEYMLELRPNRIVTMWLPLVELTPDMGTLQFLSGSHRVPETNLRQAVKQGLVTASYTDLRLGEATFHCGHTLHYAPANVSAELRKVLTVTYFPADATVVAPGGHPARVQHLERYFPGLQPGDPAASPLNPVLYP